MFLTRIDHSHWDRIHSFLTTVHSLDDGYVGKQPKTWKEYSAKYLFKQQEPQECRVGCPDWCDIIVIMLNMDKRIGEIQGLSGIPILCTP